MLEEKLTILQSILGSPRHESKSQLLFFCPKCSHHKPKLAVNIDEDVFKCWICGWQGSTIRNLVKAFGRSLFHEWCALEGELDFSEDSVRQAFEELNGNVEHEQIQQIKLPSEFTSFVSGNLSESAKPALAFLYRRGLSDRDIFMRRLGYALSGKYENSIIVPSFNVRGSLNYFVSRNISKNGQKYNNPPRPTNLVFNEMFVDWRKPVILVEGVFDMFKAGFQAIPLLGSSLSERTELFQKLVKNGSEVYLALDPDAKEKENFIARTLLSYDLTVNKIDLPDERDVGALSKDEFRNALGNARPLSADTFVLEQFNWKL